MVCFLLDPLDDALLPDERWEEESPREPFLGDTNTSLGIVCFEEVGEEESGDDEDGNGMISEMIGLGPRIIKKGIENVSLDAEGR